MCCVPIGGHGMVRVARMPAGSPEKVHDPSATLHSGHDSTSSVSCWGMCLTILLQQLKQSLNHNPQVPQQLQQLLTLSQQQLHQCQQLLNIHLSCFSNSFQSADSVHRSGRIWGDRYLMHSGPWRPGDSYIERALVGRHSYLPLDTPTKGGRLEHGLVAGHRGA